MTEAIRRFPKLFQRHCGRSPQIILWRLIFPRSFQLNIHLIIVHYVVWATNSVVKQTDFLQMSPSCETASCATTQELTNVYGTQRFIPCSQRVLHWSIPWTRSIQSKPPHSKLLRSILTSTTYVFVFLMVSFLLAFPSISYMCSSSPLVLILFDLTVIIIKYWKTSVRYNYVF
jgi:hypothetical protein